MNRRFRGTRTQGKQWCHPDQRRDKTIPPNVINVDDNDEDRLSSLFMRTAVSVPLLLLILSPPKPVLVTYAQPQKPVQIVFPNRWPARSHLLFFVLIFYLFLLLRLKLEPKTERRPSSSTQPTFGYSFSCHRLHYNYTVRHLIYGIIVFVQWSPKEVPFWLWAKIEKEIDRKVGGDGDQSLLIFRFIWAPNRSRRSSQIDESQGIQSPSFTDSTPSVDIWQAFLLFIISILFSTDREPASAFHPSTEQCLITIQVSPKHPTAICSIRSVHVLCDAGGAGGSMVVRFSVEKERPNKIRNLVQNDTFRETRISCRQRSSSSFSFPPTQIHSSDNDPRQEIMHCLNSPVLCPLVKDQVENRTVTFAIYEDSEISGGNLLCPSEQVVEWDCNLQRASCGDPFYNTYNNTYNTTG